MRAAVVNVLGEAPKYQSFRDAVAERGEDLIRVKAAGLHPVVRARASGQHYSSTGEVPLIPGVDGVGIAPDGRRVYFGVMRPPWGTMAELAPAPNGLQVPVPDGLDSAMAAAIANPGMSAWLSLQERGGLVAGEAVLVMGATGVAGGLAVQVARRLGAKRVIGVGRNVDALKDTDVDAVIGLNQPEEALLEAFRAESAQGIDLVIDYLWGRPTELLLRALATGFKASATQKTRLVEVGTSAGPDITLPGAVLRSIDLHLLGSGFGSAAMDKILAAIPQLFNLAAEGKLTIDVETVPLEQVESAWNRNANGRRIVFTA
ncbi:MAG TPA: zinc-binding alcohol dehydrogenase family protein [Terracidiphilus sp.]|jgi:NADPH:quinone reductase-like Zn-dependent oxidoreductase|nr:zinc-binding alcohol dehydrogenase family protein [Terracidiphilus sp.]